MGKSAEIRFNAILDRIPEDANHILDIGCARHNEEKRGEANLHDHLIENTKCEIQKTTRQDPSGKFIPKTKSQSINCILNIFHKQLIFGLNLFD